MIAMIYGMKLETRTERLTEEERQTERFSRRETPAERARRIRAQVADPATVAALRRLWTT